MATFLQWFLCLLFTCWWRSTYPRLHVIACSVSVAIRGARVLYLSTLHLLLLLHQLSDTLRVLVYMCLQRLGSTALSVCLW